MPTDAVPNVDGGKAKGDASENDIQMVVSDMRAASAAGVLCGSK
jgi:hypothetical protein